MWEKVPHAKVEPARLKAVTEELVSVASKILTSREECANSHRIVHSVALGEGNVEEDVSSALIAVSGEGDDATNRKLSLIWPDLKNTLKEVMYQLEIESKGAILRIRTEHEHHDRGALQYVAAFRAMLHRRVTEVCCSLPDATNMVAVSNGDTAVVESGQTDCAKPKQATEDGSEAASTKDVE